MSEKLQKTKWFWKNNYFLILSLIPIIVIIVALEITSSTRFDFIPHLFGDQRSSLFDLWSIQHFLSGVLIGALLITPKYQATKNWQKMVPLTLFFAFGWEALELLIESGGISTFSSFWNSREHWSNRLISDPALVFVGGIVGYVIHDSWKVAIVPTVVWLALKAALI
ncbi:hypothetical protein ACFL08_00500 [Patescibacteria group bacterium]